MNLSPVTGHVAAVGWLGRSGPLAVGALASTWLAGAETLASQAPTAEDRDVPARLRGSEPAVALRSLDGRRESASLLCI